MAAWSFEFKTEAGDVTTLNVWQETGHWAQNIKDGVLGKSVFAYDTTWHYADGSTRNSFLRRNELLRLRRWAKQGELKLAASKENATD